MQSYVKLQESKGKVNSCKCGFTTSIDFHYIQMQGIHISTGIQEATYSDFHRKLKDSEICREAW